MLAHLCEYKFLHQILVLSEKFVITHKHSLAGGALLCQLVLYLDLLLEVVSGELLGFQSYLLYLLHFNILFLLNLLQ